MWRRDGGAWGFELNMIFGIILLLLNIKALKHQKRSGKMTLKELRAKIESSENGWYRKFEDGWHRTFKVFAERIQGRMEELKNGKDLDIKSSKEDRGLLQELLTFNNGTCCVYKYFLEGSGISSWGEWDDYIMNNEPFINSLQIYMKNPDDESCYNELIKNCKYKADELIERIAATCTQNVSILCTIAFKPEQFNNVVTYLETSGIIERGAVSSKGTWFAKNQALMQIMEKELGDSLDKYQRSMFVGEIWIWWTKNDGLVFGSFTDPRDGKVYKTVKIAEQTWMAENLNYDVGEGCWCYGDDEANGEKYGRLYTLNAGTYRLDRSGGI